MPDGAVAKAPWPQLTWDEKKPGAMVITKINEDGMGQGGESNSAKGGS